MRLGSRGMQLKILLLPLSLNLPLLSDSCSCAMHENKETSANIKKGWTLVTLF